MESNIYARRQSRGINTGDAGILERWIRSRDSIFEKYDYYLEGKEMGQLYWESLVKAKLDIPV